MRGRMRGLRAGDPHHDCADNGPETRTTNARTTGRSPVLRMRGLRATDPHHECADYGPETRTTPALHPRAEGFVRRVKLATLIMSK